jgi:hypothetical protein
MNDFYRRADRIGRIATQVVVVVCLLIVFAVIAAD